MGSNRPHARATALVVVGASVAAAIGVWFGIRRAVAQQRMHSAILNETLPVHSKWWRDHAALSGDILYVALGDSAAQGIGASAPGLSYVGVIADRVREVTGRTVRVVNLSISGATLALAISEQLPKLKQYEPDLVTVALGANDIANFEPARFERELRVVLAALPSTAIVADIPCFYLPWNEQKVAVANAILRPAAAELGLTVAPLHDTMMREGIRGMLTQFARDLFHPNDGGYRVWASAFLPAVTGRIRNIR